MSVSGKSDAGGMPTESIFAELELMQQETRRNDARSLELDVQLQAIDDEISQDLKTHQESLDKEKEVLLTEQQSLNGRLAALMSERDRLHEKDQECFSRMESAEKGYLEMIAKLRNARKGYAAEALRLLESGQNITRHYVIELDQKLKEVEKEVDSLKSRVHQLCEKASLDNAKQRNGSEETFSDYSNIKKSECRSVWKIVQELATDSFSPPA